MDSLNLILNTVMGIFLLRDDPSMARIYQFLITTCCSMCAEQCGGGLSCLLPFVICNVITVVLQILLNGVIQFLIKGFQDLANPSQWPNSIFGFAFGLYFISVLAALVAQIAGSYIGWQAYKVVRDSGVTQSGGDWGGGQASGGGGAVQAPARESRPASNFQPFTGGGQRLGS